MPDTKQDLRRALVVVHESGLGPVAMVGEAIAASLRAEGLDTEVGRSGGPIEWSGLELVVIGCAATALASRRDRPEGLRHWLATLPHGGGAQPSLATYETRISRRGLRRGAATCTARGLWSRGWRVASTPATFFVSECGALGAAELTRATRWGHDLGRIDDRHRPLHDRASVLAAADDAPTAELASSLA